MEHLAILLNLRDIKFHYQDNCIMCFPHIINICSQHVIAALTKATRDSTDMETDENFPVAPNGEQTYQEACARDPIALGRNIVRVIRASGQRRDDFHNTIRNGNENKYFKDRNDQPVQLPELELLHDVKTRWDSVYFMIMRLLKLRLVSPSFELDFCADSFTRLSIIPLISHRTNTWRSIA